MATSALLPANGGSGERPVAWTAADLTLEPPREFTGSLSGHMTPPQPGHGAAPDRAGGNRVKVHHAPQTRRGSPPDRPNGDRITLLVFNGDFDRVTAAFMMATGGAASGFDVTMYFAFWGLLALKQGDRFHGSALPPSMPGRVPTSCMSLLAAGELLITSRELGVRLIACQTSMEIMGITADELVAGVEPGGASCYLTDATRSKISLVF